MIWWCRGFQLVLEFHLKKIKIFQQNSADVKRQKRALALCDGDEIFRDCSLALLSLEQGYDEATTQD